MRISDRPRRTGHAERLTYSHTKKYSSERRREQGLLETTPIPEEQQGNAQQTDERGAKNETVQHVC